MDYRLELKPAVLKNGTKYRVIQITDIALHTAKKAPTASVGKKMLKAFETMEPDRVYIPIAKGEFTLEFLRHDPDLLALVKEEEAKGYKVLLSIPKDLPLALGKDTIEFLKSKNGKRVLRGLAKKKCEE